MKVIDKETIKRDRQQEIREFQELRKFPGMITGQKSGQSEKRALAEENPKHLEDFKRLFGAAVKRA